jgi:hypothetical protein
MAHSSGFSITGLTLIASGSGFATDDEYDLIALDPGQGSGFEGIAHTNGSGQVSAVQVLGAGSNYSSGSWSYQPTGSTIGPAYNSSPVATIAYGATRFYTNASFTSTNKKFCFYDGWGYLQVLTYTSQTGGGPSYFDGVSGWRIFPPEVSQSAQYGNAASSHPAVPHLAPVYNVERSKSREPGSFTSIAMVNAPGSGSLIVPTIGFANTVSINSINVEKGISGTTADSDIHDLYQAFNTVARTSKKNFDWYGVGPIYQTNSPHPIRFDEFFSTDFDAYGGSGCFSIDTPITMADRTTRTIEDLSFGEEILSLTIPTMPLDFDDEDTWKEWETNTLSGSEYTTSTIKEIYFDWYQNYYILNNRIKTTFEHPFFVKHNGKYEFVKTEDLIIGDEILTDTSGSFTLETITSIEKIEEELETVNLNVEPSDVYFAGGVLVHNVHSK